MLKQKMIFAIFLIFGSFFLAENTNNQNEEFVFTVIKNIEATSVKDQAKTGTCWSFGSSSFIESELLRLGKGQHDLSEMFFVRNIYPQKAQKYVRLHGSITFGEGSLAQDVMRTIRLYGIVPDEIYRGGIAEKQQHNHGEMVVVLKSVLDAIIQNKQEQLSSVWPQIIDSILDIYLGTVPKSFIYKGRRYTPKSFAEELAINPNDYIELTSFTHHPFYAPFSIEIPDNWAQSISYNLPLDELIDVFNYSLSNNYTIVWDGDISEKSFSNRQGIATLPIKSWSERSKKEKENLLKKPEPEKEVTQEYRQQLFDNYSSTDDHLMHITGIAKDQKETIYYKAKNSWGTDNCKRGGYVYMSTSYVKAKTISILVHKNAIPQHILIKLK